MRGDRRFGWLVTAVGIVAIVIAALILLTLVSAHAGPITTGLG